MLAERPSARGMDGAPSAASLPRSSVSDFGSPAPQAIGNYKGVMLCNRPGVVAEVPEWVKPTKDGLPVFRAGVPHEAVHPRGRDSRVDRPAVKIPARKKRHDAMEAHRAWLESLVSRRAALQVSTRSLQQRHEPILSSPRPPISGVQAERDTEDARRAEAHQRVAEQQQAFRDLVRSQQVCALPPSLGRPPLAAPLCSPSVLQLPLAASTAGAAAANAAPPSSSQPLASSGAAPSHAASKPPAGAASARARPAWARSAAVQEAVEEDEARELLDFAGSLDYDR